MTKPPKSHTPENYRITLKEHLDHRWSDWFEGMDISTGDGETFLTGRVADQAALHGLLIRIRDMNLTLLQVERLKPKQEEP